MLATHRQCAPLLGASPCALGGFPVVSKKTNRVPSTTPPPLSLSHSEHRDIHSGAAASSSCRAIAPARCMTSGRGGGRWRPCTEVWGFIPCVLDCERDLWKFKSLTTLPSRVFESHLFTQSRCFCSIQGWFESLLRHWDVLKKMLFQI